MLERTPLAFHSTAFISQLSIIINIKYLFSQLAAAGTLRRGRQIRASCTSKMQRNQPQGSAKDRMLAKLRAIGNSGKLRTVGLGSRSSKDPSVLKGGAGGGEVFPFPVDAKDHCETGASAYDDITPVLHLLAQRLGKTSEELHIYDPYFCDGAVVSNLAARGFSSVYNRREDFYQVINEGTVPDYDVLVTNPPYSGDHMEKMLRFCVSSQKPWLCLVPNFMYTSEYYRDILGGHTKPFFITPVFRYEYHSPANVQGRREGKTSPFVSFWFVDLTSAHNAHVIKALRRASDSHHAAAGFASVHREDVKDSCVGSSTGNNDGGEGRGGRRSRSAFLLGNGATLSRKLTDLPQRMRAMWDKSRRRLRKKQRAAIKRRGRARAKSQP
jgi:hypothetical protein